MGNAETTAEAATAATAASSTASAADHSGRQDSSGSTAATQAEPEVKERLYALQFGLEKSLRYHSRRRAHYERLHRLLMFGVIMTGSAAFAKFADLEEWFGLAAATLGATDLVFSLSLNAHRHMLLHRRFTDLLTEINRPRALTLQDIAEWEGRRRDIEHDEPPIFWELEADCHREVAHALGLDPRLDSKLIKRLCMHWIRFERAVRA